MSDAHPVRSLIAHSLQQAETTLPTQSSLQLSFLSCSSDPPPGRCPSGRRQSEKQRSEYLQLRRQLYLGGNEHTIQSEASSGGVKLIRNVSEMVSDQLQGLYEQTKQMLVSGVRTCIPTAAVTDVTGACVAGAVQSKAVELVVPVIFMSPNERFIYRVSNVLCSIYRFACVAS